MSSSSVSSSSRRGSSSSSSSTRRVRCCLFPNTVPKPITGLFGDGFCSGDAFWGPVMVFGHGDAFGALLMVGLCCAVLWCCVVLCCVG